jgi:hypothetical protein
MNMNLDSMEQDELWTFWGATKGVRPIKGARELFPARPKGYVTAFKNLGHYAANKATATSCRLAGDVDTALSYERIADSIYSDLPVFARW